MTLIEVVVLLVGGAAVGGIVFVVGFAAGSISAIAWAANNEGKQVKIPGMPWLN